MKKVTFYTQSNPGQGSANIIMQMKWSGTGCTISTGKNISAEEKQFWDTDIQRIKYLPKNTIATKAFPLNKTLDDIEAFAKDKWKEERNKVGIPDPKVIKAAIRQYLGKEDKPAPVDHETLQGLLNRFWKGQIKKKGKDLSMNTRRCYLKLKNHIHQYKPETDFNDVTVKWWEGYMKHFKELAPNSIAADLQTLRSALNYATRKGYNTKMDYKDDDFYAAGAEVVSGYLKRGEIEKLATVGTIFADYFILACETGARFSDWDKFNKMNIQKIKDHWFFTYTAQKTGIKARVLCSPLFLSIYRDKHNQLMPPIPSYKLTNRGIKAACVDAGIREITPHEGRRSFCTNHYLDGMNVKLIMKMSGHKTEKAFNAYIKIEIDESGDLQIKHAEQLQKEMAAAK